MNKFKITFNNKETLEFFKDIEFLALVDSIGQENISFLNVQSLDDPISFSVASVWKIEQIT